MNFAIARRRMVEAQVRAKGVSDPLVLSAMSDVPRHLFVEEALQNQAYGDFPLPIGHQQTISQPFMVAFMTAAAQLRGGENVLEIGTGSGYQAAVLAKIAGKVFTVERIPELARRARRIFDQLGSININLKVDDGTVGWPDRGPYDAIIVTAGAPRVPLEYAAQLVPGGRLIIPVGPRDQQVLKRLIKQPDGQLSEEDLLDCRFVPLIGRQGWEEQLP